MKRILSLLILLAAATGLRAQLLESQEFSAIGDTGVAVHGYIEFWQNTSTTGTIKLYVDNYSVYRYLDNSLTGFENGVITGFGFDVGTGFTWTSAFTQTNPASAIPNMATGTDAINFAPEQPYSEAGVSMDIGSQATNPQPQDGLAGGYTAGFTFGFSTSTATYFTDNFNAAYFFGDADGQDLYFRFQAISSNGVGTANSDKVYVTWDNGGGGFDNPVPEPSTYGLFGAMALMALVIARRKST